MANNKSRRPVGKVVECGGVVAFQGKRKVWLCYECGNTFHGKPANHYVRLDA